jgi:hypothetical protein
MARDNRLATIERKLRLHTYILWGLTMLGVMLLLTV